MDMVSLFLIPEFHLSRIYIKKNPEYVEPKTETFMYLYLNNLVHKIQIQKYIKNEL